MAFIDLFKSSRIGFKDQLGNLDSLNSHPFNTNGNIHYDRFRDDTVYIEYKSEQYHRDLLKLAIAILVFLPIAYQLFKKIENVLFAAKSTSMEKSSPRKKNTFFSLLISTFVNEPSSKKPENEKITNPIGNDVEDDSQVPPLATREVVKKTTSSKKKDVPPPTADKARANKNRPKPTGNEAAFRDRNAGHAANRSKPTEPVVDTKKKGGNPDKMKGPGERRNRTGKSDSAKKLKQSGWTDKDGERELEVEEAAEEDAEAELAEEDSDVPEKGPAKKSLQEYLAEVNAAKNDAPAPVRKVEKIDGEKLVKSREEFVAPTVAKKEKQKAKKEKQILEFDATFSDELPREPRNTNNKRGGSFRGGRGRGGARGGTRSGVPKGGKKPFAKTATPAVLDDKNFPSL